MAYATAADLTAWLGNPAPDDAVRLLARAQLEIDFALRGAVYTVDGSNNPTDATVIAALKDASTAQVEWWLTIQDEAGASDLNHKVQATDQSVNTAQGPGQRPRLAPRAAEVLYNARLLPIKAVV